MRQSGWKMFAGMFVLMGSLAACGFAVTSAWAQNPVAPAGTKVIAKESATTKAAPAVKAAAPAKKAPRKAAGRLPVHYSDLVTEEQKVEIYAIKAGYAVKLGALTEQIKAIQAQQNAEIEALLSDEQQAKLKLAKDAAAFKRKQKVTEAAASAKSAASAAPKKVATE